MAKRYPITRSDTYHTITALACDPESAEVFNFTFALSGTLPNEKNLKKVAQTYAPNNSVVVSIVDIETAQKCFGVTMEYFLAGAVELDPKTRKPIIVE